MTTTNSTALTQPRPDVQWALEEFDVEANQAGFVGLQIAPAIEAETSTGEFPVLPLESVLQKRKSGLRGATGRYARVGGEFQRDTFATKEHGFEEVVDDRQNALLSSWFDMEMIAAKRTRAHLLQEHEYDVITAATAAASATDSTAATTVWTDTASTPIDDIRARKIAFRARTGVLPNAMVIDWEIVEYLRDNVQVIDRINDIQHKDLSREQITAAILSRAFDLEVIVSGGMENTAAAPNAPTLTPLWDKTECMIFRRSISSDTTAPRFMNTIHWSEDGSEIGGHVEDYEEPQTRGNVIRIRQETDEKVIYAACAEMLSGVAA